MKITSNLKGSHLKPWGEKWGFPVRKQSQVAATCLTCAENRRLQKATAKEQCSNKAVKDENCRKLDLPEETVRRASGGSREAQHTSPPDSKDSCYTESLSGDEDYQKFERESF
ncbi:unnamed protein product [Arctia plantaginis]|uniref:Uncharacterized protein n=1 Tax=Arctia plantaginis TaxID=874455 RepID=A0A8S0Z519_ARCPL|nr:unnamed protein product [Arctia plantaginis]